MGIRVDKGSIKVESTKDPNIVIVTADITTDPDTIKEPDLKTYSVKWNKNTGWATLRELFKAKIDAESSAQTIEDTIKNAVGEELRPATKPTEEQNQDCVINANNATVNQV